VNLTVEQRVEEQAEAKIEKETAARNSLSIDKAYFVKGLLLSSLLIILLFVFQTLIFRAIAIKDQGQEKSQTIPQTQAQAQKSKSNLQLKEQMRLLSIQVAKNTQANLSYIKNTALEDTIIKQEISKVFDANKVANKRLDDIETKLTEAETKNLSQTSDEVILYQSKKHETLWSIAKENYGKGYYYPVLIELNPGLSIYNHFSYGNIRILKKQAKALEIYKQNTFKKNNIIYYRYPVLFQDSWEKISKRFYGNSHKAGDLISINSVSPISIDLSIDLTEGMRVAIPVMGQNK
jgi:nucleoid-associated protein YgaU